MMFGRDDATPVRLDPLPEVDPYPPPPPPAEEVQLETIDEGNVTE
jgi:hypothetical protein